MVHIDIFFGVDCCYGEGWSVFATGRVGFYLFLSLLNRSPVPTEMKYFQNLFRALLLLLLNTYFNLIDYSMYRTVVPLHTQASTVLIHTFVPYSSNERGAHKFNLQNEISTISQVYRTFETIKIYVFH